MSTSYSSTLNLLKGHPNSSHLPTSLLQSSFNRLSPSSLLTSLNYGPESGPLSLKTSLAQFLSPSNPPSPNQIFITNGISHSLSLLTSTLKPKIVYTESPTYFLSRKIFEDEGAQVIDVPMKSTHGGIDIPLFSSLLSSSSSPSPKFLYIIPTHNNPTSYTYSLSERKQLVDLCIANEIYLIADEVYHFLTFDNTKDLNERVRQVSEKEWVVGLGSFTKIWSPGIRCGWIECDSSILKTIEKQGYIRSQGGINPFTSEIMSEALIGGEVSQNVTFLNSEYAKRVESIWSLIEGCSNLKANKPEGGYFIWLEVLNAPSDFIQTLENDYKLIVMDGKECGGGDGVFMRICFACLEEEEVVEGVERLVKAVEDLMG